MLRRSRSSWIRWSLVGARGPAHRRSPAPRPNARPRVARLREDGPAATRGPYVGLWNSLVRLCGWRFWSCLGVSVDRRACQCHQRRPQAVELDGLDLYQRGINKLPGFITYAPERVARHHEFRDSLDIAIVEGAGEQRANLRTDLAVLGRVDERQRQHALADVEADRLPRALAEVHHVVRHLEGDAQQVSV